MTAIPDVPPMPPAQYNFLLALKQKIQELTRTSATTTPVSPTNALLVANNLSDLSSVTVARSNLGLGTVATHAVSEFLLGSNNLTDVGNVATARSNLGAQTHTSWLDTVSAASNASAFGNLARLGTMTVSARGDWTYGAVTGGLVTQFGYGCFRVGHESNESIADSFTILGAKRLNAGGSVNCQFAGTAGIIVCNASSNYGGGQITRDAVGVLGQSFSEAADSRLWGGCFEAIIQAATNGAGAGLEANIVNNGTNHTPNSLADNPDRIVNLVLGSNGTYPGTAAVWLNNNPTPGWYYGVYLNQIISSFMYWETPKTAGCVGLDARSHANWGTDFMRVPSTGRIVRWNAGNTTVKMVLQWDDSGPDISLGDGGDNVWLAIGSLGANRKVEVGAADSGGTGYRMLRVTN